MTDLWKASAIAILTVILGAAVGKTEKDISVVLIAVSCCVVVLTAMRYLSEVIVFLWQLNLAVEYGNPFLEPLLKITGAALLTELTCMISTDAGNSSLGKAMLILGNAVMLVQAVPIFEAFFTIVQEILRFA